MNGTTGVTITPQRSGVVLIILTGNAKNSNPGDVYAQLFYNTTYATAHDVDTVGFTPLGTEMLVADNNTRAFSLSSVVSGLTLGTTYYFDLAIRNTSTTATISNISISIVEL